MTRLESILTAVLVGASCSFVFYEIGRESSRADARPARPAASASASASVRATPSAPSWVPPQPMPPSVGVVLPASSTVSVFPAPAGITNYDGEVCRSINTTCGGFYDQSRCTKSPKSWTALLTPGQVNCVIAAQGLLDSLTRVRWIQNCAPEIDCKVPR